MVRKVEVVPFSEQWAEQFRCEADKIKDVFQGECVEIYHIGSTTIPGMCAKHIIDIMVEVHHIDEVDRFNKQMAELGYEALGEHGIVKRRFFRKGGEERTHHVHIYQTGSEHIERHLAFKEYMVAHPNKAKEYSKLKQMLAQQFPFAIESYIEGKDSFIKKAEQEALAWYRKRRKGETGAFEMD
ncbi:GrpB family protein [Anoxybacteroides tepidamans]|uniref:GrpB family protein n=1 Tax=Anoxybacteroides tepidamans TaxID=265948 RepID=UPI000553A89A|nr:GrpB family protein [Anoxybacillus tepidamans]